MDIPQEALKLLRFAALVAAAVALVNLLGCVSYRSLLFQRERIPLAALQAAADQRALTLWPTNGPGYRGLVARSNGESPSRGTIVVFHGNAGMALHRRYYIEALEPLGYRVVLAEYPGYGARGGRLTETLLIRDGVRTSEEALQAFGGPLYVWGESMGCAVASGVAAELKDRTKALVLLTPWNNLPDLAAIHYPRLLARLLVRERFDNAANLKKYGGPTAFILAGRDEVVTLQQGRLLFDSYAGPKKLWLFPAAGHNSWPSSPILPWWREVILFGEQPSRESE